MQPAEQSEAATADEQARLEADYAAERQQSRLQQLKQGAKQAATQVAATVVKKRVKKIVWRVLLQVLIAIFGNPWTYVILAAILLIVLGYACVANAIECASVVGLEGLMDIINLAT